MNGRADNSIKLASEGTQDRASAMDSIVILGKELNMLAEQWELFEERTSAIYLAPDPLPGRNEEDIAYDPTSQLLREIRVLSDRVRDIRYRIEDAKERVQL